MATTQGLRWQVVAARQLLVGVFLDIMALSSGLFICFLLWGGMELCYAQLLWDDRASRLVVKCLEDQLVVTVNKDLFGTGKLVNPADLTLGPEGCKPQVSVDTDGVVRFEVGLHECGNILQVRFGPLGGPGCGGRTGGGP